MGYWLKHTTGALMKQNSFLVLAAVTAVLLLTGCPAILDIINNNDSTTTTTLESPRYGSLSLSTDGTLSRTIQPSGELIAIAKYKLSGTGPSGAEFTPVESATSPIAVDGLIEGSWSITVDGLNSSGATIATKTLSVVIVSGQNTDATFTLRWLEGSGNLDVTVSWHTSITSFTRIHGILRQGSTEIETFDLLVEDANISGTDKTITKRFTSLNTGSYDFVLTFHDASGNRKDLSYTEQVNIYDAMTSTGTCSIHVVSFEAQGGSTPSPTALTVMNGSPYGTLATTAKPGYVFAGWWTGVNGIGTRITSASNVDIESNQTLYAAWTVTVGGIGEAGGYVFYDDFFGLDVDGNGTIENHEKDLLDTMNDGVLTGARYLEAAPAGWSGASEDPSCYFGVYRLVEVSEGVAVGTGTEIGDGKANTEALVAAMGTAAYQFNNPSITTKIEDYAARLCDLYKTNGYDDWFLPSKDELNQMYQNLHLQNLGGFSNNIFWSSSEASSINVWCQIFNNGIQETVSKPGWYKIRPVRAF